MNDSKNKLGLSDTLSGYSANILTERHTERVFGIFNDTNRLITEAKRLKNVNTLQSQGNIFEQLEVMKFNYDALKKDSNLIAKATAGLGKPTDPVDIIIKDGEKVVREVQAKSTQKISETAFRLSQQKYEEMQRLGPSDQHDAIVKLLKQRIDKGTLKSEDYEQTLRNLKKSLSHGNVESTGTTYQEAKNHTDAKIAESTANKVNRNSAMVDMHKSGIQAGTIGAGISGSVSMIQNIHSVYKGEMGTGEAFATIVMDAGKGFASGYAVTALSKGTTHAVNVYLGESVAKAFAKSNASVAVASGVVQSSKSIVKYINGEITGEQLTNEISHTAITGTSSFYYAGIGQLAIPIPVVGAMVGAAVGYFIGNMIHQSGLIALGDAPIVAEAKKRRKEIEAMCLSSITLMQENRIQMESYFQEYFSHSKNMFTNAFDTIDSAMFNGNPEKILSALENINQHFGYTLKFKNFEEFDELMLSNEAFKF